MKFGVKMGNKDISNVDFSQKQIPGEYEYYGRMGDYDVYEPLDYISSMALGVNTGWRTTGRYLYYGDPNFRPSKKDAQRHFEEYTSKGIRLIYLLDSKTHYGEYAIAIYPERLDVGKKFANKDGIWLINSTNFELFNAQDDNIWDLSVLPKQVIDEGELGIDAEMMFDFKDAKEVSCEDVSGITLLSRREAKVLPRYVLSYFDWWWLRAPGECPYYDAIVYSDGLVFGPGYFIGGHGTVRPALILNFNSSNLKSLNNGDIIKVFDHHWYFQDNFALLMGKSLARMAFNEEWLKGNDYETSNIKKWLDNWFKEQKEKFGGER